MANTIIIKKLINLQETENRFYSIDEILVTSIEYTHLKSNDKIVNIILNRLYNRDLFAYAKNISLITDDDVVAYSISNGIAYPLNTGALL